MQLSSPQPDDLAAIVGQLAELCSDAQRPVAALRARTRQLGAAWSGRGRSQLGDGQTCAREMVADQAGANRANAGGAGMVLESVEKAGVDLTGFNQAGVGQVGVRQAGVEPAGVGRANVGQAGVEPAGVGRAGVGRASEEPVDVDQVGVGQMSVGQVGAGQTAVEQMGAGHARAGLAARDPANQAARDLADCGALMRGGSRTFFAASLLLPCRVCAPATALYAFCRLADDAIDDGVHKQAALRTLRHRLEGAYAGAPADLAADRALAAAVARHDVPRALPEALLEGFEWDAEGRRYEDLAALHAYAARVAGTVGAMMAVLMGVRSRDALARACELGIAMQLTNIARDVGSDARAGRIYLPLSWLRREGIDPEAWLADPVFTPALGRVVQKLLAEAAALYARAASGIACLPADCRPAIRAAGLIYAEIGQEIAAAGYDSVSRRARVTGSRKAALILRSLAAVRPRVLHARAPGLPEAQFLVDAAFAEKAATRRFAPARAVEARVLWLLDLFEQLDQRRLEAP